MLLIINKISINYERFFAKKIGITQKEVRKMKSKLKVEENLKVGNKVKYSGFDFVVVKIHNDIRKGMADIRNDRGMSTIDIKDLTL